MRRGMALSPEALQMASASAGACALWEGSGAISVSSFSARENCPAARSD